MTPLRAITNITSIVLMLCASSTPSGCHRGKEGKPAETTTTYTAPSQQEPQPPPTAAAIGNEIIIETNNATFSTGTIVSSGDQITYEHPPRKKTSQAPKDRVYVIGTTRTTKLQNGEHAACKTGTSQWSGCMIVSDSTTNVEVQDALGKTSTLEPTDVIALRPDAQERVRNWMLEYAGHREFLADASCPNKPTRPSGWEARPGEEVVALYDDGTWRTGRVRRLTPTNIHISWEDKSPPSIRTTENVVPKPKKPQTITQGQRALARPRKGSIWTCCLVEKVENNTVLIVDSNGTSRKARTSDIIPVES